MDKPYRSLADLLSNPLPPGGLLGHRAGLQSLPSIPGALSGYIFEVETADTLAINHTRQQCELFAAYVRQHGGKFALFVPAGEEARARLQLAHWEISAEVW
jgi:hypothetical protein